MANTEWFKHGAPFPESSVQFKTFEAEKVFIYAQEAMTREMVNFPGVSQNAKFDIQRTMVGQLVYTIKSMLVSGRLKDTGLSKTIQWPDGVWQMFKERHMPEWFKQKFPVRWHTEHFTIETNHYFVCPHIATDPQAHHIKFMATGTRLAGEMNTGRY